MLFHYFQQKLHAVLLSGYPLRLQTGEENNTDCCSSPYIEFSPSVKVRTRPGGLLNTDGTKIYCAAEIFTDF